MSNKRKRKRGAERLVELKRLAAESGIDVVAFSPIHCRVFGDTVVDYWPTTKRTWITGSTKKAAVCEPQEVVALAREPQLVVEQEAAIEHMRAIVNDDGPPPWE